MVATNSRIDLQRRMKYEEVTQRLFIIKMQFHEAIQHFLIPYFYFLIINFSCYKDTKNHKSFFMSRLTTSPFGGLRGLTNSRIDLQRRMKYEEVTLRFLKKCNFTKLSSTSLILIFTFLLFIFLTSKAPRHKEPRRFFYFRNENFPLRGIEGAPKQ